MGMVVRTNTMAVNAYRQLGMNNSAVSKSLEKLASGYRINRAGDDAAGLAISEKMKAQITGLETASANAQDGISLIQTAEGNLSEVHDMLNRMVELASKSANGTYTQQERQALQDEVNQLLDEIDRISKSANFNGAKLLDGSLAAVNAIENSNIQLTSGTNDTVLKGTSLGVASMSGTHENADNPKVEKLPSFAINLEDYKLNITATTQATTFAVSLGSIDSKTVTIYDTTAGTQAFTQASTNNFFTVAQSGTSFSATDIAGVLHDKVAVIGTDVYTMANDSGKITFTYVGQKVGDACVLANDPTGQGKPQAGSAVPRGDISVNVTTGGTAPGGSSGGTRIDCHVTDIKDPQAADPTVRGGVKLTLTEDIIKAGSLTIGDTTFTFDKTLSAGANGTPNGATPGDKTGADVKIGIKDFLDADGNLDSSKKADMLKAVTEQMSHCTAKLENGDGTKFDFNIGRGSATDTIEIEEQQGAGAPYGKFTFTQMADQITQTRAAENAKAEITMSKDKEGNFVNVSAGSTLTVDGTDYKFVEGTPASGANEITVGKTAEETISNIQTALASKYDVTANTTTGKITLTRKASATDPKAAFGKTEYATDSIDNGGLTLQIGDTAEDFNKMTVTVKDMSAKGLGLEGLKKTGIMTEASASKAIDTIKDAINTVSSTRAGMGALQNRLEHTINNLDVAAENLTAANSRIRDTDMAKEMMNYTKMNVLVQSAQAMLAQANQQPQSVLQLLQ